LIIPNCKEISNDSLVKLLVLNPSLLDLDISNKQSPFIDQTIVAAIAQSCRCLTVLKISDYQFDDPNDLLILCGKVVVSKANNSADNVPVNALPVVSEDQDGPLDTDTALGRAGSEDIVDRITNVLHLNDLDSAEVSVMQIVPIGASDDAAEHQMGAQCNEREAGPVSADPVCILEDGEGVEGRDEVILAPTEEEEQNQRGKDNDDASSRNDSEAESDDNKDGVNGVVGDFYQDDPPAVCPLEVEDHNGDVGCLELDTLWLENVNLTDQVAAVLLQTLFHLREVNFSGTDICNPWRLIDKSSSKHYRHLEDLDIKSTSLSRSALQLIPEIHPDLWKLSISSTTLPPPTYRNITKLSGLGDLQLIGGQFYPCEPDEIFVNGILPAVSGVGRHLESLNMTFFAHVDISKIALSCPVIRHLDLSHTDIFFTIPCSSLSKHCPYLVSLNLSHAHIEARDPSTLRVLSEDAAIQQMVGEPNGLEELNLSGLTLSSDGIRTLFHDVKYPLKCINVEFCKTLTVAGMCHLWKVCPLLTRIDMTHSRDISISDCERFVVHCHESRPAFKLEGTLNWK
jgi:hypothetical protein